MELHSAPKFIYLDQNVSGVIGSESQPVFLENFNKTLLKIGVLPAHGGLFFTFGVASFIERLGIAIPFKQIQTPKCKTAEEWFNSTHEQILLYLQTLPELSIEGFKAAFERQYVGLNNEGKGIFLSTIKPYIDNAKHRS